MLCWCLFVDGFIDHQDLCISFVFYHLFLHSNGKSNVTAAALTQRGNPNTIIEIDCVEAWNIVSTMRKTHSSICQSKNLIDSFFGCFWLILHHHTLYYSFGLDLIGPLLSSLCVSCSGIYDVWRMIEFVACKLIQIKFIFFFFFVTWNGVT